MARLETLAHGEWLLDEWDLSTVTFEVCSTGVSNDFTDQHMIANEVLPPEANLGHQGEVDLSHLAAVARYDDWKIIRDSLSLSGGSDLSRGGITRAKEPET